MVTFNGREAIETPSLAADQVVHDHSEAGFWIAVYDTLTYLSSDEAANKLDSLGWSVATFMYSRMMRHSVYEGRSLIVTPLPTMPS